jgi:N-hydroxyarylamine O-acetyltransferase
VTWRPVATDVGGEWENDAVPMQEYLRAIGAGPDPGPPSAALLTRLHRLHLQTFAFEGIDPFLGTVPSLAPAAIGAKIANEGRCGYCFEQNMLFAGVLENLGFRVHRLGGRMRLGSARARGKHMALAVEADGGRWLADVGFGADGLIEPLPWQDGAEAAQDGWRFRFDRAAADDWVLAAHLPGVGWFDLYSASEHPQHRIDFEITNYFIGNHPRSPFTGHLVAQYRHRGSKVLLRDRTLTEIAPDGARTETEVGTDELGGLLADRFRVRPGEAELAALTERLTGGVAAPGPVVDQGWARPMEARDPAEARQPSGAGKDR